MLDAVVIGAGQAGLGVSLHLTRRGIEHTVLERGRVAETWRSQRWDSFVLNTPNWMNRLPGEADPVTPRDAFLTRDRYAARLQDYADDHRLPVRTNVTVTSVTGPTDDGSFIVATVDGSATVEIQTHSVVVASGILRVPRIPALAKRLPTGIQQTHAGAYRRPTDLPSGAVLIVGGGQSGVQIAEDLLGDGRAVYLCTSAVGRLRRRYRGRDTFEWLVEAGFYDVPLERLADPKARFVTLPLTSGLGRFGHTVSLQSLSERGVILLGRPTSVDGDRITLDDTVAANVAFGDARSAEFKAIVDDHLRGRGIALPPLESDPADAPHPDPASIRSPRELDLDAAGVASVIWTTGFGGDLDYLPAAVLDATGAPVHRRGVADIPGIFFLGFPWLSTRKSGIIHGVDDDSRSIADAVGERLASLRR